MKGEEMRIIKMSGGSFRRGLLRDENIEQQDIATYTGINGAKVSNEIRDIGVSNNRYRKAIYDYYKDRPLKPISYEDFWKTEYNFKEIK